MTTGTLVWMSRARGFGYLSPDAGGPDLLVRRTDLLGELYETLRPGDRVDFRPTWGGEHVEVVAVIR
jgi:CspA family cold shock protein